MQPAERTNMVSGCFLIGVQMAVVFVILEWTLNKLKNQDKDTMSRTKSKNSNFETSDPTLDWISAWLSDQRSVRGPDVRSDRPEVRSRIGHYQYTTSNAHWHSSSSTWKKFVSNDLSVLQWRNLDTSGNQTKSLELVGLSWTLLSIDARWVYINEI